MSKIIHYLIVIVNNAKGIFNDIQAIENNSYYYYY